MRLNDVAQRGHSAAEAFVEPQRRRLPIGRHRLLEPQRHDAAKPVGKPDAALAQRRRQVAEIEMRVGVDQSGQNGHVAQIADCGAGNRSQAGDWLIFGPSRAEKCACPFHRCLDAAFEIRSPSMLTAPSESDRRRRGTRSVRGGLLACVAPLAVSRLRLHGVVSEPRDDAVAERNSLVGQRQPPWLARRSPAILPATFRPKAG